jgi:hypothetical protein
MNDRNDQDNGRNLYNDPGEQWAALVELIWVAKRFAFEH